jgi:hypothetical protein
MSEDHSHFRIRHGGELREALIMLEGDDGGFELLAHGSLPPEQGGEELLIAVVRSACTDRVHTLVHEGGAATSAPSRRSWHPLRGPELERLEARLRAMHGELDAIEAIVALARREALAANQASGQ